MNYRPNLIYQPCYYSYADILQAFQVGKPLKPEQLNFLLWHARQLSSTHLDPVLRYYKIGERHHHFPGCIHSFIAADDLLSRESVQRFKEKLETLLKNQHHGVMVKFTGEQLHNLMSNAQIEHIIYFDNNKLVVESPIFRGKRVHAYFFQVGNIVGIIRYELVKDALKSETDALVYFEELRKRELTEYIHEFYRKYNEDVELLKKQQFELQEILSKIQLDRNQLQDDILQNDMSQKAALENEFIEHQHRFVETPQYQTLPNEQMLPEHLFIQQRMQYENELQNESLEAELEEVEQADTKLIEQKRLQNEQLQKQKLEQFIAEQNRLEKERVEKNRYPTHIPDYHKEIYKSPSIFPPRLELKHVYVDTKKEE
jgi:hypothetical protein